MRKILTWILVMAVPLVMLSSCSLAGNEYKNICGFLKSLVGKDIATAEAMIEKQYNIDLTRGEPVYRTSESMKDAKYDEDYYEYKTNFTVCGIEIDTIYLNFSKFTNGGYDGTVFCVIFSDHQLSREEAKAFSDTLAKEYSGFLKADYVSEIMSLEDGDHVSSDFTEGNYHFFFKYFAGNSGRASFELGVSNNTSEYRGS